MTFLTFNQVDAIPVVDDDEQVNGDADANDDDEEAESDGAELTVVATRLFQMGLGHPSEPMCINPGKERNGFLSFL